MHRSHFDRVGLSYTEPGKRAFAKCRAKARRTKWVSETIRTVERGHVVDSWLGARGWESRANPESTRTVAVRLVIDRCPACNEGYPHIKMLEAIHNRTRPATGAARPRRATAASARAAARTTGLPLP